MLLHCTRVLPRLEASSYKNTGARNSKFGGNAHDEHFPTFDMLMGEIQLFFTTSMSKVQVTVLFRKRTKGVMNDMMASLAERIRKFLPASCLS